MIKHSMNALAVSCLLQCFCSLTHQKFCTCILLTLDLDYRFENFLVWITINKQTMDEVKHRSDLTLVTMLSKQTSTQEVQRK